MREGTLTALRLPERLSGGAMPSVEVIDMRHQQGPLSGPLIDEIGKTHSEGRQSILFLNRRGFSYLFHCRSCGYEMACTHCSVALTYHKERERMICHYCGRSAAPITVCPQCGSLDVGYSGYGTEGIEEELQRHFPRMVVRRIDTDAVKKKKVLRQALADFREGRIHVLVGHADGGQGAELPRGEAGGHRERGHRASRCPTSAPRSGRSACWCRCQGARAGPSRTAASSSRPSDPAPRPS